MEILQSHPELEVLGFNNLNQVYWQLHTPQLYEQAVRRQEGFVAHLGPLVVHTGDHQPLSKADRYIVREPLTETEIWWEGQNPFEEAQFNSVLQKMLAYFQGKNLFVQNLFSGADMNHRHSLRIISETAWHSLFARNMFIRTLSEDPVAMSPEFTVIHAPGFHASPSTDGTNSSNFMIIHLGRRLMLIGGTSYAGDLKKAVFTTMNFVFPKEGVLPLHCSANEGDNHDTALYFGLSGTGKTSIASDSTRTLIGDDEHGWGESGIFNLEGGCYASVLRLSAASEPEIYQTTRRFGTILENVYMNMTNRRIDLNDSSATDNSRASYPISHIPNATTTGKGDHPQTVILLAADAFGVIPPVSKLSYEQALYYFLSGYTAGVPVDSDWTEPAAMFSACFSEPYIPRAPSVYAEMFGDRIKAHDTSVWLVNTGWVGQTSSEGERIKLRSTRAIVRAILDGSLSTVPTRVDPILKLYVPEYCPNLPDSLLNPQNAWTDREAYQQMCYRLAGLFKENFASRFNGVVDRAIEAGGPG